MSRSALSQTEAPPLKAIVVTFDHLPVSFLGLHGNTWIDTPAFDRLAAEGVVFDQHYAASVGDAQPKSAWFRGVRGPTSLGALLAAAGVDGTMLVEERDGASSEDVETLGFEQGLRVAGSDGLDVDPAATPFARLVQRAGEWLASPPAGDWLLWLKSRGVPSPWLPPREFADRYVPLFEEFEEDPDELEGLEGVGAGDEFEWELVGMEEEDEGFEDGDEFDPDDADERAASEPRDETETETVDVVEERDDPDESWEDEPESDETEAGAEPDWAAEEAEEFDHLLRALAGVGERESTEGIEQADWLLVRAVYAGYVALLDRGLGELREAIARTVGEDVLLIVAGGQGESLGERVDLPEECDALGLGEEVVHTPLIVRRGGAQAGSRRGELVQTLDLGATLFEAFGLPDESRHPTGRSLLPLVRGESHDGHESLLIAGCDGVYGLRTSDRYLIRDASGDPPVTKLFVKPDDVWDLADAAGQELGTVEELTALLDAAIEAESNL